MLDIKSNYLPGIVHIAYAAEDKNGPQGSFSSISLPSIAAGLNGSLSVKRTLSIIPLD
jgi:hypothetical protein